MPAWPFRGLSTLEKGNTMARWPTVAQKAHTFQQVGYKPSEVQWPIHQSGAQVLLIAGGERSGKSRSSAAEVLARTPWCHRSGQVAVVAQEYDQSRSECEYLIGDFEKLGLLTGTPSLPKQGTWSWDVIKGTIGFETISLSRAGVRELTGRGKAYDIVLICESGLVSYDTLLGALGRVSETRGLIILSGTLWDNHGWYAELYKSFEGPNIFNGAVFALPTWANLAVYPGGEDDPEIKRLRDTLPADDFSRRVAAQLVPSPARIYPEFECTTHVKQIEYDPEQPVYLAVDPGYRPSRYAILALQIVTDGTMEIVNQIDEIWEHDKTHHDVIEMCRARNWWHGVTQAIGGHETKQHQAAASTAEVWRNLVGTVENDPEDFSFTTFNAGRVLDGIVRVKTFLSDPALKVPRYYCAPGCTGTQQEFQVYKRRTDSKGGVASEEPQDKDNDAMDALRNFLVQRYGLVEKAIKYGVFKPGKRRGMKWG